MACAGANDSGSGTSGDGTTGSGVQPGASGSAATSPSAPSGGDEQAATDLIDQQQDPASAMASECARDTYKAERSPVNLYLLLDISGSMDAPVAVDSDVTQWDAVRTAIEGFIASPDSAGLELALNYYPSLSDRTDCDEFNNCAAAVPCITRLCDLRYFLFGDIIPCSVDLECGFQFTQGGQTYVESCAQPGRCDNAPLTMCFGDSDCDDNGACVAPPATGLCPGEMSCSKSDYEAPAVSLTPLPDTTATLVDSLAAHAPDMFARTPTQVALQGAYRRVAAWQQNSPSTKSVVVLATDGAPVGCNGLIAFDQDSAMSSDQTFQVISDAEADGISTYVIGVVPDLTGLDSSSRASLQPQIDELEGKLTEMAQRGGTEGSFNVSANDTTTDAFLDALANIRGQVLPCDYQIPAPESGTVNFSQLNVELSDGQNANVVPKVNSQADCVAGEDAWYYNADPEAETPTRVILCPSTCDSVQQGSLSQVDIFLGCATVEKAR
jgi:Mg-chelatase subunit ChlD